MSSSVQVLENVDAAVFTLRIPRHLDLADVQVYLDRMGQAVDAGTPFGCVFEWLDGRPRKTKPAAKAEHDWLDARRGDIGKHAFGIAMVSTTSLAGALPRLALAAAGPRMFGCPCKVVATGADALRWLGEQRAAKG